MAVELKRTQSWTWSRGLILTDIKLIIIKLLNFFGASFCGRRDDPMVSRSSGPIS